MELTKERLEAWRNDEVTKEVFNRVRSIIIEQLISSSKTLSLYGPNNPESYPLTCAFSEGRINGLNSLHEIISDMQFKFNEEDDLND